MLRKKIDDKRKELEALRAKDEEFTKREAELEQAINEAQTDEEQQAVEQAVGEFEAEKAANDEASAKLDSDVRELEDELAKAEAEQDPAERKENKTMEVRDKVTDNTFVMRDDVKAFLAEVRTSISEKRALTNVGLTIPTIMLPMIREIVVRNSKLAGRVNRRALSGNGREVIMGTVPEAVWTECCATLNEIDLSWNDVEVDCNKVGAFISVCNATLEDSDIDLATTIMDALGQSIALALDKAILYGTGSKMPLGIMTRLAQTAQPGDYPATARAWADLHETNIVSIPTATEGVDLFKAILLASGNISNKYSNGEKFWAMNEYTRTQMLAQSVSINAAGAIAAGMGGTMPIIGGEIVTLDFIPNNVMIGGYGALYLLAERHGIALESSEHFRFIQDQTVFKGTARYDGVPVIPEGFIAIGINGVTPTAAMTFAPDTANTGA